MTALLLQLVGPMQSWGTASRFDDRDTQPEPSKSGVLGLLAAAMGIDREDWDGLEPLTRLAMVVRHDRPGTPDRDFQTAGCARGDLVMKADGSHARSGGVVSTRHFLADAAFLVVLEGGDASLLRTIDGALGDPRWPLALGRKAYVPSEQIRLANGLSESSADELVRVWPWISSRRRGEELPERLMITHEVPDRSGSLRMDQPLAAFGARRFGARWVRNEWVAFPGETHDAIA